ncbi:unnamed protein product [Cyclocybe aegerita]|uniref:Uncharacterized protein n=1 Tax=Cyclocybe aegerita TaxID=1973307 RepID=A0A8S0VSA5_CYCAE|nr:unnamed protein product [Cyclocybe aegerita]
MLMPTASEYIPSKTPAWDPSSRTLALSSLGPPSMVSAASIPMEDRDMSWLKDPHFERVRAKLLEKNTVNWKALEFVSVSGDQVHVKDLQLRGERTINIANLQPVVPDMTGDFVTVTAGPMAGKIFKITQEEYDRLTRNVERAGVLEKENSSLRKENREQRARLLEEDDDVGKPLPHPEGRRGRKDSGFALNNVLAFETVEQVNTVKGMCRVYASVFLNLTKTWSKQNHKNKEAMMRALMNNYPVYRQYKEGWVIKEILMEYLENKASGYRQYYKDMPTEVHYLEEACAYCLGKGGDDKATKSQKGKKKKKRTSRRGEDSEDCEMPEINHERARPTTVDPPKPRAKSSKTKERKLAPTQYAIDAGCTARNAQDAPEAATSAACQATGASNPGSAPRQATGTPRPGAASTPCNTAAPRPVAVSEPAAISKPVAAPRPVAVSKPAAVSEPAAISKPVAAPRPVAVSKPAAVSEPAAISKPVAALRPVAASKPAPVPKPVAASSAPTPLPPDNAPNSVPTSDWLKAPEEACFNEIYVQTPPFATITNRTRPSAPSVTEKVQATSEAMATPPIDRVTESDGPGAVKTKSASGKGKSLRNAAPPPAMRTTCSHAAQKRKSDDSQESSRPPAKKQCMDIQRCPHDGCVSIPVDGLTQKLKRTLDKLINGANLTPEHRDKLNVQVHDELRAAVANMAQELDWPLNVDFKSLPDRLTDLEEQIFGLTDNEIVLDLCYLWLSLVKSLQKAGANAEDLSHWEDKRLYDMMRANLHASYYGPMSMKIIEDWFVKTYPQDTTEPKIARIMADVVLEKMIGPLETWWTGMQGWTLTYRQFLDLVAIPGIANILIEDDTGLTPFEVEKLRQDSYSYGVMFHRVTAIHTVAYNTPKDAPRTGEPLRLSRKKVSVATCLLEKLFQCASDKLAIMRLPRMCRYASSCLPGTALNFTAGGTWLEGDITRPPNFVADGAQLKRRYHEIHKIHHMGESGIRTVFTAQEISQYHGFKV